MGYHRILDLADAALVAYIIAGNAGTSDDVLPAKAVGDKTLPLTICAASSFSVPDEMAFTGNMIVSAEVAVLVAAFSEDGSANTVEDSSTRASDTFDLFAHDDTQALGAAITAALGGEFTCMACRITGGDRDFGDDRFQDKITLELLCCPSALT